MRALSLRLLLASALTLLLGCPQTTVDDDDDDSVGDDDDDSVGDDDDDTGDDDDDDDSEEQRSCTTLLRSWPEGSPSSVQVGGSWNGFDPSQSPMVRQDDGSFLLELDLAPGAYAYKFVYDGNWEGQPPPDVYTHWWGGVENRNLEVIDCQRPELIAWSAGATGSGNVEAEARFVAAATGAPLDPASIVATVGGAPVEVTVEDGNRILISESELPPGKHTVRIQAADVDGAMIEDGPLYIPLWVEAEPFDWRDATMYFTFTDRFRDGAGGTTPIGDVPTPANYQGGDFPGITQTIEEGYFEDLGANFLWLSPVYDNPEGGYIASDNIHNFSGFHGYWPIEARWPENRFGSNTGDEADELHRLIEEAHARGIRVLFDLVLNHVHEDHHYLTEHPDWFGDGCVCGEPGCDWNERTVDCWFRDYLPDLNYQNHAIVEQMVDDVLWWAKEYDIDAFRVDAAKHMDHVIMRTLRMRVEEELDPLGTAPYYIVGETFVGGNGHALIMDYVADYELHGQFDFPLYWTIRSTFAHGGSFRDLEAQVVTGEEWYGDALMSPFLGNHDIARYATETAGNGEGAWGNSFDLMAAGGTDITQQWLIDEMSMAFAFVLTQPGVPLIYYGDEIGLAGDGDPDNRRFMMWEPDLSANNRALLSRVQALGQARQDLRALRRGGRRELWLEDDLYVYLRSTGDGDSAIVAMNKGSTTRVIEPAVPMDAALNGVTVHDVLTGAHETVVGDNVIIALEPMEYVILAPR